MTSSSSEIELLSAQVELLKETLTPFAEIAKELSPSLGDCAKNTMHWAVPTVGELRAALAAIQESAE